MSIMAFVEKPHRNQRPEGAHRAAPSSLGPIHVVHVVSSLEIGGQERVVLDLGRGLRARGHRVTVVTLADGGALRPAFGDITTVAVARSSARGVDPLLPFRLRKLLVELAPEVVHTHNPPALFYAAPAARSARLRLIHTKHGANPTDHGRTLAARRLLCRLCAEVVAVSEETAQIARE